LQLVTRLENEIHKMEVQWNEAEHIRKKYRSIKSSLMMDSEKFESTILKMEEAIREQQQEINQLQSVYQEALQMRDSTKSVLTKQEQTTIASNKSRMRQADEFRRAVEERKAELERLERKIFSTGTKIIHQESGASSGKIDDEDAAMRENKAIIEANFKKLMTATGVTVSHELVDRFLAQREASARLTYLRNVTEHEKKRLESQREQLTLQLDVFKFSDNRESEV
jgi:coiled-coil domain-containing protein 151